MRRVEFDILKGIGIILMMIGHWTFIPNELYRFIYSFHMPLFFIVSGYFLSDKSLARSSADNFKIEFRREYIPYILTAIMCVLFTALRGKLPRALYYCLVFGYGSMGMDFGYGNAYIGTLWFLLALFWAKLGYYIIRKKTKYPLLVSILISTILSFAQPISQYLPFCLLQGATAIGFVAVGSWIKDHQQVLKKWWVILLLLIGWVLTIRFGATDIALVKYRFYLLSLVGGIGGTLCLYYLSVLFKRFKLISTSLAWVGMHSLTVYCVYAVLAYSSVNKLIYTAFPPPLVCKYDELVMSLIMMIIVFVITAIVIHIPYLNKIFK